MKKRFIAGAVCPRCGQLDRLLSYTPEGSAAPIRECVACGFKEELRVDAGAAALPTRVEPIKGANGAPSSKGKPQEQVIKFMPIPKKKS